MAGLPSFITLHMRVVLALSARVFVVVDIHMLAQPAGLLQFKVILHLPTPYFIQKLYTRGILSATRPYSAKGKQPGRNLARMFA
jgi:hypothetical protein